MSDPPVVDSEREHMLAADFAASVELPEQDELPVIPYPAAGHAPPQADLGDDLYLSSAAPKRKRKA